mmetsp:Transcript_876/g.2511  ORF Transcript_876/g.2511 Transcript_876/m.2511 type:complete len:295 (-) Transcript_876:1028-1912(-)
MNKAALASAVLAAATVVLTEAFPEIQWCSQIRGRPSSQSVALPGCSAPFVIPLGRPVPYASILRIRRHSIPKLPLLGSADDLEEVTTQENGGDATVPNLTVSLVKAIVGSGVLALPAGVASLGNSPSAVLAPSAVLIVFAGLMNAFFFTLIGRVCYLTGATSYKEAWELSVGERGSDLVTASVTAKTALSCLAFSMVLADSFRALLIAAGFLETTRTEALLVVTISALLPLCLLKDLKSLATFSALGLGGMAFTTCTMAERYFDGTYDPERSLAFLRVRETSDTTDLFGVEVYF